MRIKIFHILKQDDKLQEGFMNVLHKAFEASDIEEAKGEDYDLIHVIGIPTKEMTRMIRSGEIPPSTRASNQKSLDYNGHHTNPVQQ